MKHCFLLLLSVWFLMTFVNIIANNSSDYKIQFTNKCSEPIDVGYTGSDSNVSISPDSTQGNLEIYDINAKKLTNISILIQAGKTGSFLQNEGSGDANFRATFDNNSSPEEGPSYQQITFNNGIFKGTNFVNWDPSQPITYSLFNFNFDKQSNSLFISDAFNTNSKK